MIEATGSVMYSCPYCGFTPAHRPEQCFMVKSIEYFPNGGIKRIEKVTANNGEGGGNG